MKPPNILIYFTIIFLAFIFVFAADESNNRCRFIYKPFYRENECENEDSFSSRFGYDRDDEENNIECFCWCKKHTLGCRIIDVNLTKLFLHYPNCDAKIIDITSVKNSELKAEYLNIPKYDNIKKLIFESTRIEKIEDFAFDKFFNLTSLNLARNLLKNINENILSKTIGTKLRLLDLSHNSLQNLSTTTFQYLRKLEYLDLKENHGINLESEVDGKNVTIFTEVLSNLKTLNLGYCSIHEIGDEIFINLRSLTSLTLTANPLTNIPKAIKPLFNLQEFYFRKTFIKALRDCDFCELPSLKILDVSHSKNLTHLHENAFGTISSNDTVADIEEFSIANCNISVIPEKLLNWKNITINEIYGNPLTCGCDMAWLINDISTEKPLYANNLIHQWTEDDINFEYALKCHDNSILKGMSFVKFNGSLCNEKDFNLTEAVNDVKTTYYVCSGMDEEAIDAHCWCEDNMVSCEKYWLYNNLLNHTNIKVVQKNFTLEIVKIYGSNITVLQKDKILPNHQTTIKSLEIINTNISHIEKEAFDNLSVLKSLKLDKNQLKRIDSGIFTEIIGSTLLEMSLEKNQLQFLPSNVFVNLTKLDTLFLGSNPNILSTSENFFIKAISNLKTLELKDCNISSLDDDIFLNLTNLATLDLSNNPLNNIPIAIKNLHSLEKLVFKLTNLKEIESCEFCSILKLKILELDNNYDLSYIHENAFGAISKNITLTLKQFTITGCNISKISKKLLNWKNIETIDFQNNPWICDCSAKWFINDINNFFQKDNRYFNTHHHSQCHGRAGLVGSQMSDLSGNFCGNDTDNDDTVVFDNNSSENVYYVFEKNETKNDSPCFTFYSTIQCNSLNHTNIQILRPQYYPLQIEFSNLNTKILTLDTAFPESHESIWSFSLAQSNVESIKAGTFDNFTTLSTLKLTHNLLKEIDETVFTSQLGLSLLTLDLSYNRLTTFKPAVLTNIKRLRILNIAYNPGFNVTSLSTTTPLKCLRLLDLSNCNITTLDEIVFSNFENLRTLHLSFNPLTTIPTAINYLQNLESLYISGTNITTLTNNDFFLNTHLMKFIAEFSNLERIEDCAFCSFPNLIEISFYHSKKLSFIHENAFGAITNNGTISKMRYFIASDCNLSILPEKLLNWSKLRQFDVKHNPFICDCVNKWLIEKIKNNGKYQGAGYQCYNPPGLKGVHLFDVTNSFCYENLMKWCGVSSAILATVIIVLLCCSCFLRKDFREFDENETLLKIDFDNIEG